MNNFFTRARIYLGQLLVQLLGDYAPAIVANVTSPALASGLERLLGRTAQVIKAVTDENPEDGAQLEAILSRFLSEDVVLTSEGFTGELLLKIQNERARRGLTLLSVPVLDALRLLTDDDPNNAAQAEATLDAFLSDPDVQNYIITDLAVPTLERLVPNPLIRGFIMQAVEVGIQEGLREIVEKDVFDRTEALTAVKEAKDRANAESVALGLRPIDAPVF